MELVSDLEAHSTNNVASHMPRLPFEGLVVKAFLKLNFDSWKRFLLSARTVSCASIFAFTLQLHSVTQLLC